MKGKVVVELHFEILRENWVLIPFLKGELNQK